MPAGRGWRDTPGRPFPEKRTEMEKKNYEQVRALVENWDYEGGCGPWEDSLPEADELRELNRLSSGVYILFCRLLAGK